ncbi:MAG TPA: hypothetical protein VGP82_17970, partial [Ktedonobacterales bacterium]|nr:hypothetical protein [Ktedonobacterales bacterium]
ERVTALERRMLELERQLRFFFAQEPVEAHTEEQRQDSVATVHELLRQLVQETGRLGPLLGMPEAGREGTRNS